MLLAGQASGTPGFLSLYPTKEVLRGWVKASGLRFFFFFFPERSRIQLTHMAGQRG